jgi:hypothetical protein
MNWSYESYWKKANEYYVRANAEGRDKPMYGFWSSLTLEFLARATIAKIHPALLADTKDEAGENLLYAFGLLNAPKKIPKSIAASSVFSRCSLIYPDKLTGEDEAFCRAMAERRNSELHSGERAFEKWPNHTWLATYYRVCSIHLSIQDKDLSDLFDGAEVDGAKQMIEGLDKKWKAEADRAIGIAKSKFDKLSEEEKEDLRTVQDAEFHEWLKFLPCPACGISAMLWGQPVHFAESKLHDDMIKWDISVLPTSFKCTSCGLELVGHGLLHAAQLGGQFSMTKAMDPLAYYAPNDVSDTDYYDWHNDE